MSKPAAIALSVCAAILAFVLAMVGFKLETTFRYVAMIGSVIMVALAAAMLAVAVRRSAL